MKCKCGCGIDIELVDKRGRSRLYINGHNKKKQGMNWPERVKYQRRWKASDSSTFRHFAICATLDEVATKFGISKQYAEQICLVAENKFMLRFLGFELDGWKDFNGKFGFEWVV